VRRCECADRLRAFSIRLIFAVYLCDGRMRLKKTRTPGRASQEITQLGLSTR
jgi:hypothetical protein